MIIKGIGASEGIGIGAVKIITTLPSTIEYFKPDNNDTELSCCQENVNISKFPTDTIIVTDDLTASAALGINGSIISGIVTANGGYTSHSAIISRASGIPAVLNAQGIFGIAEDGDEAIIDGSKGIIILSPTESEKSVYREKAAELLRKEENAQTFKGKPSFTADGEAKKIFANADTPAEGAASITNDAEGIGLMRTEFLYMNRPSAPPEHEQYEIYKKTAKVFGDKPVTIRTIDIGSDKLVPYMDILREDNPIMGFRGIRFCLKNQELFRAQLRALLRASTYGNIRIMIPMITTMQEIREVKRLRDLCIEELRSEGKGFDPGTPLGIMIETPAAAVIADRLAKEVDFFSIGTNDLIGYTMAADRGNSQIAELYSAFDPAVLRITKYICSCAHNAGIPVSICGEAASDPALIPLLLSFGIDEFSVNCRKVLSTRCNLSLWKKEEADNIARHALSRDTAESIKRYLEEEVRRRTK